MKAEAHAHRARKGPRILAFRVGELGDMLVAVPALHALRDNFPGAPITLLGNDSPCGFSAAELFRDTGLIDTYLRYPAQGVRALRPLAALSLLARLRSGRHDLLAYLAPSRRAPGQVARDHRFFRLAGLRHAVGLHGFPAFRTERPLETMPREADLLLGRLAAAGLVVPPPGEGRVDLLLGDPEQREVRRFLAGCADDGGATWIGVGPASRMPAKLWPVERYERAVADLLDEFDAWPVVFGGTRDRAVGDRLVRAWGRGHNAAGLLGVRAAAAALGRCALYVGNDTGTMHLAAAAGTRCVAVFSAREAPGCWYPYGAGHVVLRAAVSCEGCQLTVCEERGLECLRRIEVRDVVHACRGVLRAAGTEVRRVGS